MDISPLSQAELNQFKSVIIDCGLMIEFSREYNTQDYRCYLAEKCLLSSDNLSKIFHQLINLTNEAFDKLVCRVVNF